MDASVPTSQSSHPRAESTRHVPAASLLTGGSDRPYVFGLTMSLLSRGATLDVIGSDELDFHQFHNRPRLKFLKFRGDQRQDVGIFKKAWRISSYYGKLIAYAAVAKPRIFHILWNNRFESFDRTILMAYYKLLRKKVVLTAHNVNADKRDRKDTFMNRMTLRMQYWLSDHVFVHTEKMKAELVEDFAVQSSRVTVIPFGINNSVPDTILTSRQAKERLGVCLQDRVILFFGRITPYKGIEYLIGAFRQTAANSDNYRLIIAGRVDRGEEYWRKIKSNIEEEVKSGRILLRDEFIPDEETEVYFKASDVLVLPYKNIYQSGVLFLAHSFGLPVLAADVGSLTDDIIEGQTGFAFRPEDSVDLAKAIEKYFASDLYNNLHSHRQRIRDFAAKRHSWGVVADRTVGIYTSLLETRSGKSIERVTSAPIIAEHK